MENKKLSYLELENENKRLRQELAEIKAQKKQLFSKKEEKLKILTSTMEHNANLMLITDVNGNIEYANRNYVFTKDQSIEKVIGKDFNCLKTRIPSEEDSKSMTAMIESGKIWKGEFFNTTNKEKPYWEKITITPISNHNVVTNFLVVIENITARKETENALKESEIKYKLLTESIHDVVIQLSPTGELLYMSPSMSDIVNYEANLTNKKESIFDYFYDPEERKKAYEVLGGIIKDHKSGVIEFMYKPLRNQKDPFPVEVSFKPILENGELKMILLVLRDITKRKEAEKERYENEIRFKALSEATFEAVFLSIDGYGIDANEAAIKMFGYGREDISKMKSTDIIAPESRELVKKNMLSGYDKPYDGIAMRKDGTTFQAEFQGKLFEYKGKQVRVSSIRDITERKRNEELIRKSERELRISNKTKDKFFSIIAHDLKAPFSSMLGFSELLKEDFYDMEVEEQKEIINLIHKGIKNTYELLDNLLFWASSQNGRIAFRPEKLNLFLISNKEVNFLGQQASKKSITVENNIKKSQSIIGDKMMLSIIIRNLINNALKFTPKGGKLIIGCNVINSSENSYIELYFKDNGVGIPKERQAKLFDISENTSTKGTEKEVGTGLGLMLCNEFVKSHKGEITFESEVGKGTTFFVKIPV